ncbi:MAG: ABC transporter permease [Betaproteobacteria bacterium]
MNGALDVAELPAAAAPAAVSRSPNQRAWARFRRNRLGFVSLLVFLGVLMVSTFGELVSNDRPLVAHYDGHWYFPIISNPPEKTFGGDFGTPTEWHDPLITAQFAKRGNWALFTINRYDANALNYFSTAPDPAEPSRDHWLGTDPAGRDMVARLLYGFRISIYFGLALTTVATVLGIIIGAIQGYFGGRIDLATQRVIEIWNAVPELYILIIVASILDPSLLVLLGVFALFGWISLSDYVRAEFLRNRNLEFVKAARAMGLSNWQIIRRHVLPNSMTPVITFLPFRMSAAILFLTSLDFLGLGVPSLPSLGQLLRDGKENLDAWWISVPTFIVLVLTLLLLTFIGDALRDAFDTRKS